MSEAEYLVGIDLGTSNCAMAYIELARGAEAPVLDFKIPQLVRPGETAALALLPSCIYLPGSHELAPESIRLPWSGETNGIVGEFARWQGARVPGRLVASAKSWLCHPGVDRAAPILPWGAVGDAPRISPITASARLLAHMAQTWNAEHPAAPLAAQEVIITVPASFDEAARALTVQAAHQAGLEKFMLLEEPQAAFYDFTARHRHNLGSVLEEIRLILVVDVGGGTSDFTLVQAGVSAEGPVLRRIAVGEHLMLGGDNMDAALSRVVEERMLGASRRLSMTQWTQLTQVARLAKETLLSAVPKPPGRGKRAPHAAPDTDHYNLAIASEGSRLIGSMLTARVTRTEVEKIVLDGFFPACAWGATPQRGARAALQEVGLPYAQDPAITRHLAAFLRAHAPAAQAALGQLPETEGLPRPDAILLNGGVFNSEPITRKLLEVVSSWWPQAPAVALLQHDSLDLAVARGAAFYGLAKRGLGQRIGGGAAHALFVGLEREKTKQPMALCVIPRGHEEGEVVELGERTFQLSLGRPVRFPLFSTASDRLERAGDVIPVSEDLHPLPPTHALLKAKGGGSATVPVHLRARLTEIGTLELWCVSNTSPDHWRLEFELRGAAAEQDLVVAQSAPASVAEARHWVEKIFGGKAAVPTRGEWKGTPPKDVKQLWSALERTLGPREEWPLAALRELWSVVFAGAGRRRRSAEQERVFFQLLGYTLRPGFGYPLDDWRCEESAKLFSQSVQFHNDKAVWKEFWVMWRRIAGGLSPARHQEIWAYLKPFLAMRVPPKPAKHLAKPKGTHPEGTDEMARLAAGLEHLTWQEKSELGDWMALRLLNPAQASGPWTWAIGRLGARAPIFGSIHQTVPPEKAAEWAERLLEPQVTPLEGALFALAQLTRLTGDRTRDVDQTTRARVLQAFDQADASPSWRRMLTEIVPLEAKDRARALGDTLPAGLILASTP